MKVFGGLLNNIVDPVPKPSAFKNGRGCTYPDAGGQPWVRPSSQYINGVRDGKTRQACMDQRISSQGGQAVSSVHKQDGLLV